MLYKPRRKANLDTMTIAEKYPNRPPTMIEYVLDGIGKYKPRRNPKPPAQG